MNRYFGMRSGQVSECGSKNTTGMSDAASSEERKGEGQVCCFSCMRSASMRYRRRHSSPKRGSPSMTNLDRPNCCDRVASIRPVCPAPAK